MEPTQLVLEIRSQVMQTVSQWQTVTNLYCKSPDPAVRGAVVLPYIPGETGRMQKLHMAMSGMHINGLLCMKAWCLSSLEEYIDMYCARNRHDTCCTDITENEQRNRQTDKWQTDRQDRCTQNKAKSHIKQVIRSPPPPYLYNTSHNSASQYLRVSVCPKKYNQ